ncbi:hypothetical protein DFJ63DRAFT_47058 [Scheffersomyces coipomensis]|uniref:uncharacterized protein n=1 Tax=Scheffersomyces coipomensis TaxID=1788519 RepID=UPI00315C4DDD
MEEMDIDDYSRDRSRSPVRDRSRSRERKDTNSTSNSRDYRGSSGRDYHGGNSRDYGTNRSYDDRRGGRDGGYGGRGGRDGGYGSRDGGYGRRDYGSSSSRPSDGDYRSKSERNYDNSIFISNVPFDSTERDIEAIFKDQFTVKRADIVTNRGRSRGMATVEFSTKEDVHKAIEKFDKFDYNGRPLYIRQDYPPPEKKEYPPRRDEYRSGGRTDDYRGGRDDYRSGGRRDDFGGRDDFRAPRERREPPPPGTEVFIGNLPFSINWQALKDLMRQAGEVVRADVKLDWSGKSKGFGTVVFSSVAEADKAIEMFQGYEIEGRQLNTRPGKIAGAPELGAESNGGRDTYTGRERHEAPAPVHTNSEFTTGVEGDGEKSDTIYVANLPFVTSNEDLYELFETVGRTTKAEIQYNDQGKASGNAVVQFELADVAESAIQSLNNYNYGDRNLRITYAKKP